MHITGHTQGWKRVLEIFIIFWVLFKLFGFFLIHLSGDACITRLNDSEGIYTGMYQLLALLSCGVIYRIAKLVKIGQPGYACLIAF
jgi:hypothetical protein